MTRNLVEIIEEELKEEERKPITPERFRVAERKNTFHLIVLLNTHHVSQHNKFGSLEGDLQPIKIKIFFINISLILKNFNL